MSCPDCTNGIVRSLGRDNDEIVEDCPKCNPPKGPRPIADWWYCGDEICRCSQPRIIVLGERVPGGGHVILRHLEKGPFHSEAETAELREQWTWMLAAARRHNVENLAEIEEEAKSQFEWMDEGAKR